jgi:hypothetical protein
VQEAIDAPAAESSPATSGCAPRRAASAPVALKAYGDPTVRDRSRRSDITADWLLSTERAL